MPFEEQKGRLVKKSLGIVGGAAVATVLLAASPASAASLTATSADRGTVSTLSAPARANVASAAVGFRITRARCTSTKVLFTAKTYENGFSGVQRFKQRAQLQEYTTRGWVPASPIRTATSQKFPNDGRNFSYTLNWTGTHPNNGASWREAWKGLYLNGAGRVIAQTKVIYVTCR